MHTYFITATLALVLFFTACGPGPAEALETEGGGAVSIELPDIVLADQGCRGGNCFIYSSRTFQRETGLHLDCNPEVRWALTVEQASEIDALLKNTPYQAWTSRPWPNGERREIAYVSIGTWELSVLGDWSTVPPEQREFFRRLELATGVHRRVFPEEY